MGHSIDGFTAAGFEAVRDSFSATFAREDDLREVGASLAVYLHGECVVDLWGGHADDERSRAWTPDTLVNIWSATKGIAAIAVAMLVDRGLLDYGAPVTDYWPEYGAGGKEATTVAHVMSHQAGLPGFDAPITLEQFYDWDEAVARLAGQAPMWVPGTANSYHAMTYGFLAGELVRRASGKRIGRFVADEIATPLGADLFIGLPESEEHRVAPLIPSPVQRSLQVADPAQVPREARAAVTNPDMNPALPNTRAWRAAEIPAGNGHATALGLAKLYGALANGGTLGDTRLIGQAAIDRLIELQTDRVDILLGQPAFWRNGLAGNVGQMYGPWADSVGHSGWGGSFGMMNIGHGLAVGYTVKQMGSETIGDPRATALCHAICSCL